MKITMFICILGRCSYILCTEKLLDIVKGKMINAVVVLIYLSHRKD